MNCVCFLFQFHGTTSGSIVSLIMRNLYMESFEQKTLATAPRQLRWWCRYVNDMHMILKKIHLQEFTEHLNSMDDDIKWTMAGQVVMDVPLRSATAGVKDESVRVERALACLDTLIVVESHCSISTKVFLKDSHTDQYLNVSSNHPLEHKRGVV